MPTYQYACTSCGERLEAVQKFTDDPLTVCPACDGRLRKVFSAVGVVFKGSGFYKTDSRTGSSSGSGTKSSGGDGGSTDKPAAAGEGSGDSAPAKPADKPAAPAKTESKPAGSSGDRVA